MILTSPTAFLSALPELPPVPAARATARAAFLVAPAAGELDEIEKAGGSLRCCVAEIF